MQPNLSRLCRQLHYEFNTVSYLKQALTHRSAAVANNERLEFLGDSILSFTITQALFEQHPNESEGQLSRTRAWLVKGETLAEIALELQLGDYLKLGQGELKSGGFRRASILADAMEAIFAAVFLDSGIEEAKRVILTLYQTRLKQVSLQNTPLKDAKTQLQEHLQALKHPLPQYTLVAQEGEEHNQVFHTTCSVATLGLTTTGKGNTRRAAEQAAAEKLLEQLVQRR